MRKLVDNPRGIYLVHPAINTITLTVGFKACSLSGPVPHLSFFDSAHAQQLIKKKQLGRVQETWSPLGLVVMSSSTLGQILIIR